MATTTIRVGVETRAVLLQLASATGATLMEIAREAANALHRERFAARVREEIATLRSDPGDWADYLADEESTSVTDGID